MSPPDRQTLDAEQKRLNDEFAKYSWFRGSYWGFPLGRGDAGAEPGWVVQVAAGHAEADEIVSAAGRRLRLSGAPVRQIALADGPRLHRTDD